MILHSLPFPHYQLPFYSNCVTTKQIAKQFDISTTFFEIIKTQDHVLLTSEYQAPRKVPGT